MGIHRGLNDLPTIYQQDKTVIRNGVIHKQKIWKDTNGNELEKISDNPPKFAVKRNPKQASYYENNQFFHPNFFRDLFPPPQPMTEEDNYFDFILLFTIFCLIFVVFLAGYVLGCNRVRNPPICTQFVTETKTDAPSKDISTWT